MKLVFLDLDGVLVTRRQGVMEQRLVDNLKKVIQEGEAQIVLSSDWRRWPEGRRECKRVLRANGMDFIACTPCMTAMAPNRPIEIVRWLKEHHAKGGEKVTHWVAVDDRHLLQEKQGQRLKGHFVQTQPIRGLTVDVAFAMIRILQGAGAPVEDTPAVPQEPYGAPSVRGNTIVAAKKITRPRRTNLSFGQAEIRAGLKKNGTKETMLPAVHAGAGR